MYKRNKSFIFAGFFVLAVCLCCFADAFAVTEKSRLLITERLAQKLRSDLANDYLTVKLKTVEENKISAAEIEIRGEGICLRDENQIPIRFEARLDRAEQNISELNYDFVENVADYAPTSDEDILMKELMTQISRDYKTENIVIAIEAVENVGDLNSETKFLGTGEVRIGDLVWKRIKFDVALDAESRKANKIIYKLER